MSAATRAAKTGLSHVLLERRPNLTDTVFHFHKRKHVMASPEILPLRSDLGFKEGLREEVIETWERDIEVAQVNTRHNADVVSIAGERGAFAVTLADGDCVTAEHVVVAIGVQGNPRKLAIPGADLPFVQYQLDDPDEYRGEAVVVTGAGDAAIETALALAPFNQVTLVNRGRDYPRAKPANLTRLRSAIKSGLVREVAQAKPLRIGVGHVMLATASGDLRLDCDRIIARIGTESRPDWLERAGITFVSNDPDALPYLSETYESNVPGLYVVGALAGFPLIKHCLQQGYEVIEHILGNLVTPIDAPLLKEKLDQAGVPITVDELVAMVHRRMQLAAPLTHQQVRECLVRSEIRMVGAGDVIFRQNDYADSLFWIFAGEVGLRVEEDDPRDVVTLKSGQFVGEMGFISGRPRAVTAVARSPALLLEIERTQILRLIRLVPALKQRIDDVAAILLIKTHLAPTISNDDLAALVSRSKLVSFAPNDVLMKEGDEADACFLLRRGAVTVSRRIDGKETVVDYLPAGNHVGADAVLWRQPSSATVKAVCATEAIRIGARPMRALIDARPRLKEALEEQLDRRERGLFWRDTGPGARGLVAFLVRERVPEASNLLVIDQSRCVHCNNCEKACADTHDGVRRLDREAGPSFDAMHLPVACRHCENPPCMDDCPTDSIRRTASGEVVIDDTCTGCGNCERNCPYGVIGMGSAKPAPRWGLMFRLLFGLGERDEGDAAASAGVKRAVKCDLCAGVEGGPACVRACPTGAAFRISPEDLMASVLRG